MSVILLLELSQPNNLQTCQMSPGGEKSPLDELNHKLLEGIGRVIFMFVSLNSEPHEMLSEMNE